MPCLVCLQAFRSGTPPDVLYCRVRWAGHRASVKSKSLCDSYGVPFFLFTPPMFLQLKHFAQQGHGLPESWEDKEVADEEVELAGDWDDEF